MNTKYKLFAVLAVVVFILPAVAAAQSTSTSTSIAAQLQAEIQSLLAQLQSLRQQLAAVQGGQGASWCHSWNSNLEVGRSGQDVTALQSALSNDGESVSTTGEFDEQTASAVTGFQQKYAGEVLTPNGLRNGTGYVGKATRAKLNELFGCVGGGYYQHTTLPPFFNPSSTPPISVWPFPTSTPVITSMDPASGPVGTKVWLMGTGFVAKNNVLIDGKWSVQGVPENSTGETIEFSIPDYALPQYTCDADGFCYAPGIAYAVQPGIHQISVTNDSGTSNQLSFLVTSSASGTANVLSVAPTTPFYPQVVAAGAVKQRIGSYVITNPIAQTVNVNSVTVSAGADGNLFQNLYLMVSSSTQFGSTQPTVVDGSYYTFTGSSAATIMPSGTLTVDVYADVLASDMSGSFNATAFVGCSAGDSSSATDTYICASTPGQNIYISNTSSTQ